ncbi:MAG: GumC family protein [Terriglobales bacterium]
MAANQFADESRALGPPRVPQDDPADLLFAARHALLRHHPSQLPPQEPTLGDYWRILLKRRWTILITAAVVLLAATIISLRMTKIYRSAARIELTHSSPNLLLFSKESPQLGGGETIDNQTGLETQVKVLQGDALALQVGRKLEARLLPAPVQGAVAVAGNDRTRDERLIAAIRGGLHVAQIGNTMLIELRYDSPDPQLAADVVNTLANTYIEQSIRAKFEASMRAAEWLSKQLADMQIKMETSQQKLVDYQKQHGIVGIDEKQNITTAKLDQLNRELTQAQSDRIARESTRQLTQRETPENVAALFPNDLTRHLQQQAGDVQTQLAQATTQFGPAYPKVIELQNRLKHLQQQISREGEKTRQRIENDYAASLRREQMLQAALDVQKREATALNESAIEYKVLKQEAESNRQMYEGLLQKLKEAGLAAGLSSTNIRLVETARVPLSPTRPNIPRNLQLALLIGLVGGVALAFALEALDTSVRTPEQAEEIAALPPLGIIPLFSANGGLVRRRPFALRSGGNGTLSHSLAIISYTQPKSEIAEAYRSLRTSILLSGMGTPPRRILVTSSLPQDGKTMTSINTAVVLAQQGKRVLLVDADLRRPMVHCIFAVPPAVGLSNVLTGGAAFDEVVVAAPQPGLFILPAGPVPPHPAELLSSPRMRELLQRWSDEFDHVIIDSPPALTVTDAVLLSVEVDAVLLVIRAGQTTSSALRRTRDLLTQVNARIMGVVINAVDLSSPDYYHYYYSGSKYGHYYRKRNPAHSNDVGSNGENRQL